MADLHEELEQEFLDIQDRLGDQDLLSDQVEYAKVAKRYSELENIVKCIRDIRSSNEDIETAKEMLTEADGTDRELLRDEINAAQIILESLETQLRQLLIPKDPNENKNVIIEIRGAEGGEEANLFARDLYEMYSSFASKRGWKLEVLNSQPSDMGGFTTITFILKGNDVWSNMKYEGGPHRVQRVPVTETQGRVHTSSATVSVLPEADEIDIRIEESDLQVDVFRSSGPGGQSVNTTDSAVRITHKPTGIIVSMQDEKSQLQNKARAMVVLRSRLLQAEQERIQAEQSASRKGQMGGGGRSEKIRTYNFKENRVTDHRIGLTLYKLDRILSGDINQVTDALAENERASQLTTLEDDE
ncbi:MAG: peptide chain release factor 1 [Actinomycetota bacterium]|nr:peptide chain release factor 1 [Actinomycetota bacterium]MEC7367203.1 peptide chain release factor 1 [Actinomycetota bacterium]MEC8119783.1 peptide chain release factor 1 [Actinomycetota bacterium]MEC8391301.1 peptide chain release factor 1 [Actinomycetota bacterium]|tara:strand:- start:999 stop:2072 length:1074 start_codon:yes stop_codon:yes gene_type:complete